MLNAVVHRDYRCSSDSVIKVFDDRIEFYNPGKLPPGLTVEKLLADDYTSTPRNKQIAVMFKEAGSIEKYGSGIKRIRKAFVESGAPEPKFEEVGEGFRVTVFPITPQKTPQKNGGLSPSERTIEILRADPSLTRGRLRRKGGTKSGTWEVS